MPYVSAETIRTMIARLEDPVGGFYPAGVEETLEDLRAALATEPAPEQGQLFIHAIRPLTDAEVEQFRAAAQQIGQPIQPLDSGPLPGSVWHGTTLAEAAAAYPTCVACGRKILDGQSRALIRMATMFNNVDPELAAVHLGGCAQTSLNQAVPRLVPLADATETDVLLEWAEWAIGLTLGEAQRRLRAEARR